LEDGVDIKSSIREMLVAELDEFLEAYTERADAEAIASYVIEQLQTYGDDQQINDIIGDMEESGYVDGTLLDSLINEFESNDEFVFTGEEVVSLLERLCELQWVDEDEDEDDDDDDNTDFEKL